MNQPNNFSTSIPLPSTRGCRRWSLGCSLLLLLLVTLCALLIWLLAARTAAAAELPLTVWLLIDNSNSMFEKDGIGSDPDLLRLDAARLFLSYLGVDDPGGWPNQAAVIFFGSTAETAVPLTPLTDDEQRRQLLTQIAQPQRMGWTDHLAALDIAAQQIFEQTDAAQPIIILLTDGEPEWNQTPTIAEKEAYIAQLEAKGHELAANGISLFIILLTNEALTRNEDITDLWQPLWQQLATNTPVGQFFVTHDAAELPDIYHQVVVALTGRETDGVVVQTAVITPTSQSLIIPPNLAQLTLVIRKEDPTQTISLLTGSGQPIVVDDVQVRRLGGEGDTQEEIWVINEPEPGQWQIQLSGSGTITIWQDTVPQTLPTATTTATATPVLATTLPTSTATAMPTTTPTATAVQPALLPPTAPSDPELILSTPDSQPSLWPWFLLAFILLSGGAVILFGRRQQRLWVTGTVRLLDGQVSSTGSPVIELDSLQAELVTLGQPPADVPLPQATAQAAIRPVPTRAGGLDGGCDYLIKPLSGHVTLNDVPLTHETRLTDTAVLDLGGVRLRYENLWLRQVERERQTRITLDNTQPNHMSHL